MKKTFLKYSTLFLTSAILAGCGGGQGQMQYWQKLESGDALYLTGPKAQQVLEQDIAECVHEIIELAKLAGVRENLPNFRDPVRNTDQMDEEHNMKDLPGWDQPEYLNDLRVDHSDYHDFDGCMNSKGWYRVKYVHPDTERKTTETYKRTYDISIRNPDNWKRKGYVKVDDPADQDFMKDR